MRNTMLILCALAAFSLTTTACENKADSTPKAVEVTEAEKTNEGAEQNAEGDAKAEEDKGALAEGTVAEGGESKPANAGAETIEVAVNETSKIGWVGAKVTGDHKGGFEKFDGKAMLTPQGELTAVMFEVDTTSIFSDAEKLTGHLKSGDFFEVEKFPTASFKSTSIAPGIEEFKEDENAKGATHTVTGDLTIREVTKTIKFPATVTTEGDVLKANAEFVIDRFEYGIEYKGKADDLIKKEVVLTIDLDIPKQKNS
ncbi:MAG: YceI family protein [Myxococcota bacterium]